MTGRCGVSKSSVTMKSKFAWKSVINKSMVEEFVLSIPIPPNQKRGSKSNDGIEDPCVSNRRRGCVHDSQDKLGRYGLSTVLNWAVRSNHRVTRQGEVDLRSKPRFRDHNYTGLQLGYHVDELVAFQTQRGSIPKHDLWERHCD